MEEAAVHRLATSITQLTLCQVSTDEIDAATKLIDKACQKLRGIPDVPPQRIADLENATLQLRQLSCILNIVAQSLRATKLARRKRHYCLCHAPPKVPAPRRKSSMHRSHCQRMIKKIFQPMKTNFRSTEDLSKMMMIGKELLSGF